MMDADQVVVLLLDLAQLAVSLSNYCVAQKWMMADRCADTALYEESLLYQPIARELLDSFDGAEE